MCSTPTSAQHFGNTPALAWISWDISYRLGKRFGAVCPNEYGFI